MSAEVAAWLQAMVSRGWTVPTWPKEYGGAGLERPEYEVLIDELKRAGARTPLTGRGVNYIGPTILEFGTEAQKAKWLPICARGEGAWAMGYSELARARILRVSVRVRSKKAIIIGSMAQRCGPATPPFVIIFLFWCAPRPKSQNTKASA